MNIEELGKKLELNNIPKEWYCLNGIAEMCYGIEKIDEIWYTYTVERGHKWRFEEFKTESEACQYLYEFLLKKYNRRKKDEINRK